MVTISVNHNCVSPFVVVGKHGPSAVSVLVSTPHPWRHAVLHGKYDATVGVVGQCLLGPGIVVVLGDVSKLSEELGRTYVSIRHKWYMHGLAGVKARQAGLEMCVVRVKQGQAG